MTTIILSLIIFMAYLGVIIALFGIPDSLSKSYYLLEEKFKNSGVLFTFLMFVTVFLIIAPILDITPDNYQALAFFAIIGLGFVGAAPLFLRGGMETKVHFAGAAISAISGLAWIFIVTPQYWWYVLIVTGIMLGAMIITKTLRCYLFWVEMVVFFSIYAVLVREGIMLL